LETIKIIVLSFIFGTLSNQIGGLFGYVGKNKEKSINIMIAFTAGITTSIICFELLIESFNIADKYLVILYTIVGVILIKILDLCINKGINNSSTNVIVNSMAAHNITEGIAIGAGYKVSTALGISLLFTIMMHNIPEGMIIGTMLRKENKKIRSMLNICLIIGVFLSIGSAIGIVLGNINENYIMSNLAISAGAMLYMLACELIPGMYDNHNKRSGIIYIIGFLMGCLICKL